VNRGCAAGPGREFYRVRHPIRKVGQPPDSETLEDSG